METIWTRTPAAGDTRPLVARRLVELSGRERFTEAVVTLARAAGNPYCDWFFGTPWRARAALRAWLDRPSSELAADGVTVLLDHDRVIGMFIALGGGELVLRRKADALAAAAAAGEERRAVLERLAASRELFAPVSADEFYISRVAVTPDLRGRGLGRRLMSECLAAGRAAGYDRFCLDVSAGNEPAVRLYRSLGFRVEADRRAAGMRYLRMTLGG